MDIKNFKKLNDDQVINYIKNSLFNKKIEDAFDEILKFEKKDLNLIKKIKLILDDSLILEKIKKECNLTDDLNCKLYVYSKILSNLSFYNRNILIGNFLKDFDEKDLKNIARYEYNNKTQVSISSKIFNKHCKKYKEQVLNEITNDYEVLNLNEHSIIYNNMIKRKKINYKLIITVILSTILLFFCFIFILNYKEVKKYDGLIYPGIYINDYELTKKEITSLDKILKEQEKSALNQIIVFENVNGSYEYKFSDLGIKINTKKLKQKIISYNNKLSFLKKVYYIKNKDNKNKVFNFKYYIDNDKMDVFLNELSKNVNTKKQDDKLFLDDNYNLTYVKAVNGFILDQNKTKENIIQKLPNLKNNINIKLSGAIDKSENKNSNLSNINKKVSSYTTYFLNSGNRGHNIVLASSKLNDTLLMPGETFSYLKVVGPYSQSNGYLPAPIYLNGEISTGNGGGVCQLASTLYMAQLLAGLETIYRTNHIYAPNYVPKGLDATVSGTTVDYKFKNQYNYPVYIVSYVNGNYLTVDIWSNENLTDGKTYEPYSVYSVGAYLSYLKIIKDGNVIETKYLDKSYYKTH